MIAFRRQDFVRAVNTLRRRHLTPPDRGPNVGGSLGVPRPDGRSRGGEVEVNSPRLLTLGTLALTGAGDAPALGPRKLALLAYLALATRPLTRDRLAELFWGDRDDARARHSLREALSALRRALG